MTSLLSACLALPAATLPLVLNARAPGRDTLQSWTCGWISQGLNTHDGMPGDFERVCGESVGLARSLSFILLRGCGWPIDDGPRRLSGAASMPMVVLGEQNQLP